MSHLTEITGMKFPDEYVTRFFFKEGLDKKPGRVLELGCGNGNNLMLFYQYGWDVLGIDIDKQLLADAEHNFKLADETKRKKYALSQQDLSNGLPPIQGKFEVVLMPSVLYYIPREAMKKCLTAAGGLLLAGGSFFVRMRTPADYRYGKGAQIEPNGFKLEIAETGEKGLLNVFYHRQEMTEMLCEYLKADENSLKIMNVVYDNLQKNILIASNADIVLWGTVKK